MSLYELAGLMLNYHVYQAINLDGGGSTTMVVHHHVVNRPSDATGERPVANALLILSKAPIMTLNSITIERENNVIIAGQKQQFHVRAVDQNANPLRNLPASVKWWCDPHIGKIDTQGTFWASSVSDSGFIYMKMGDVSDSIRVYIK
jgi:hypothetical protein